MLVASSGIAMVDDLVRMKVEYSVVERVVETVEMTVDY